MAIPLGAQPVVRKLASCLRAISEPPPQGRIMLMGQLANFFWEDISFGADFFPCPLSKSPSSKKEWGQVELAGPSCYQPSVFYTKYIQALPPQPSCAAMALCRPSPGSRHSFSSSFSSRPPRLCPSFLTPRCPPTSDFAPPWHRYKCISGSMSVWLMSSSKLIHFK